ncbi:hypothetical protein V6N11_065195 [Hibiscus sabdariffa]|uniref:Uncharacterized protein n=2 Tax=Hibiscus sabdariffa TaxID=183260 RepID=A0ABR2QGA8_9ROSI
MQNTLEYPNFGINDGPACNHSKQVGQLSSNDNGKTLHEVLVLPMGLSEIRELNECSSDNGLTCGAKEVAVGLVPSGSKLLKVPIKIIEPTTLEAENLVENGENSTEEGLHVSSQFRSKSSSDSSRKDGGDRLSWWVTRPTGKPKAAKKAKKKKNNYNLNVGSSANLLVWNISRVQNISSPSLHTSSTEVETIQTLELGKKMGVVFNAPDNVVVVMIVELEKGEDGLC